MITAPRITPLVALSALALSCGASTGLVDRPATDAATEVATCPPSPPTCVAPDADDPCAAPHLVAAECDASLAWRCPAGSRVHARAADAPAVCHPFEAPGGPIRRVGGSIARVPTADGRCLWIAEDVTLASGQSLRNVALDVDPTAPSGTCPQRATFVGGEGRDAVTVEGAADPTLVVQITGGYRLGGATRVTYRLFRADGGPQFGLTQLGSGLGRWDGASGRIVVPGPAALRFTTELDLGDASWTGGGRAYVWGCPAPIEFLTEHCVVARLDAMDRAELFAGGGRWVASARRSDAASVFDAGPWVSSVVSLPGSPSMAHVFAVGFGAELQAHTASAPEGPWSAAVTLARCDLPAGDRHAFCAGPVVHMELVDPTRPRELPVSYGVGTTMPGSAPPEAYGTRLQWVRVP